MLPLNNGKMPLELKRCDIIKLKVDAIVNAANESLLGGGGVDGAIHAAAGPRLLEECKTLGGCKTGEAKITRGYNLFARHVIHTVGPVYIDGKHNEAELLKSCYINSLKLAREYDIRSIAFPIISSGIYGYPKKEATKIAIEAIKEFLEHNEMDVILTFYEKKVSDYFEPLSFDIDSIINENLEVVYNKKPIGMQGASISLAKEELPKFSRRSPSKDLIVESQEMSFGLDKIDESWQQMLFRKIDEKGIRDSDCYRKSNVDRRLFSKIRSNIFYRPKKTTALAFLFGLELSIDEAEDMLEKAGFAFSRSLPTDIIVKTFIEKGIYDIYAVNVALFDHDLPQLGAN